MGPCCRRPFFRLARQNERGVAPLHERVITPPGGKTAASPIVYVVGVVAEKAPLCVARHSFDATKLPFKSETFDISTNYGAVNGFTDPKSALMEMVRVTKKGGKILFLDEREYESATWLEHIYFKKVFAYNNTIVGCPVELLPNDLEDIQVHQVYEFVYICTARKKM